MPEWLAARAIGSTSRFGKLMLANTVTENGGDPDEQSALDLIVLLTGNPRSSLFPLPGDDERYHIIGGNDQLVSGMIAQLPPGTVRHDHVLVAIRERSDGTIGLLFDVSGRTVRHDRRSRRPGPPVQHAAPCRPARLRAVEDQAPGDHNDGYGHEREDPPGAWAQDLAGAGIQRSDVRRVAATRVRLGRLRAARPQRESSPVSSPSPAAGSGRSRASPVLPTDPLRPATRRGRCSEIEHVFPGTIAAYTGRAYEDHWSRDPWVHGAYSYYRVGQAVSYGNLAGAGEGRFVFAGEHTSIDNIGFLDGAVETGERAARTLLRRLMG